MVLLLLLEPFMAGDSWTVTSQLGTVPSDSVMASVETGRAEPLPRLGFAAVDAVHGHPPYPFCVQQDGGVKHAPWKTLHATLV